MRFSEETLIAYADGELDEETRAEVEAAMATDSDLADAIALQIENRDALKAKLHSAFDAALSEEVPARLLATANGPIKQSAPATVTNLASARAERETNRHRWSLREWGAIAATLIVGVLVGRFALDRNDSPFVTQRGRMTAAGDLNEALSSQAGGALDRDTGIQMGVSYLAKSGEYCRTFSVKSSNVLAGLACRRQNEWTVDALTRTNADASGAYRMAGASVPPLILSIVETTIAGDPLDAEQEADARERGWQR